MDKKILNLNDKVKVVVTPLIKGDDITANVQPNVITFQSVENVYVVDIAFGVHGSGRTAMFPWLLSEIMLTPFEKNKDTYTRVKGIEAHAVMEPQQIRFIFSYTMSEYNKGEINTFASLIEQVLTFVPTLESMEEAKKRILEVVDTDMDEIKSFKRFYNAIYDVKNIGPLSDAPSRDLGMCRLVDMTILRALIRITHASDIRMHVPINADSSIDSLLDTLRHIFFIVPNVTFPADAIDDAAEYVEDVRINQDIIRKNDIWLPGCLDSDSPANLHMFIVPYNGLAAGLYQIRSRDDVTYFIIRDIILRAIHTHIVEELKEAATGPYSMSPEDVNIGIVRFTSKPNTLSKHKHTPDSVEVIELMFHAATGHDMLRFGNTLTGIISPRNTRLTQLIKIYFDSLYKESNDLSLSRIGYGSDRATVQHLMDNRLYGLKGYTYKSVEDIENAVNGIYSCTVDEPKHITAEEVCKLAVELLESSTILKQYYV